MNTIDIKVTNYFPFNFQLIGYGVLLASIYMVSSNPMISPVFLVVGLLITTTHYRLEINLKEKYFKEYLWIFGFRKSKKYHFQEFSKIVINSSKRNFEYGDIAVRRYGVEESYKAFLKFSGQDETAFIGESKNLKTLEIKANRIMEKLGVSKTIV